MKKFVFSIMMSCLLAGGVAAQENVVRQNGSVMPSKAKKVPSRLVRGVEIDPLLWVHPEDKFYRIPELGIELIWDSNLEMLYVLELNSIRERKFPSPGKSFNRRCRLFRFCRYFCSAKTDGLPCVWDGLSKAGRNTGLTWPYAVLT